MNSLFTLRRLISYSALFIFLVGCQNFQIKSRVESKKAEQPAAVAVYGSEEETQVTSEAEPISTPTFEENKIPRFGIILGAGGARSLLYTGFLKEFSQRKAPVHAIAGIEWGALVAALYASKGSANDVEWQLTKIKEDMVLKKSLIPGRVEPGQVDQLSGFLKDYFSSRDLKSFSIPFSCPAIRFKTEQSFIMARGQATQAISYCLPSVGIYNPYQGYGASMYEVTKIAELLRSQGANYILLVNAVSDRSPKLPGSAESWENNYWHQVAHYQNHKHAGVDAVVEINGKGYTVIDFKKNREIIRDSFDTGTKAAQNFLGRWKL